MEIRQFDSILYITSVQQRNFIQYNFFPLTVFGGPEAPFFVFILLCSPSEVSLQWSTIPDGSPSTDWQSTVKAGEIAGYKPGTAGLQSGVATNEPPLLPGTAI